MTDDSMRARYDSAVWRTAEAAARFARTVRKRLRRRRVRSADDDIRRFASERTAVAEPRDLIASANAALSAGAYSFVLSAMERLAGLKLPASQIPGYAALLIESHLALGNRTKAVECGRHFKSTLERTNRGAALLDMLRVDSPRLVLPDGRINKPTLAALIADGALRPPEVVALLQVRPLQVLRDPELHLLLAMAQRRTDAGTALQTFNRYMRAQGLPLLLSSDPAAPFLAGMEFATPKAVQDGPLVSVIMAARNAEKTVGYAVRSILNQSYRRLELLICDDQSEDSTVASLKGCGSDDRVRLFRSTRTQGTYNVRNALIGLSSGELITFHDADDFALPGRIAEQVRVAQRQGVVATYASWMRLRADGDVVFFKDQSAERLAMVSLLAQRQIFSEIGPYRAVRFGADFEFHQRLRLRYRDSAIGRTRNPQLFGLWSERSLTRLDGSEALEDGYRAPARRLYSDLLWTSAADIDERLSAAGVTIASSAVEPL